MAHHFKLDHLLDDIERATFSRLLNDRRMTIDAAHDWLTDRGHKIGRTAVGNYVRAMRDAQVRIIAAVDLRDDETAKRFLNRWSQLLSGEELRQLAIYAAWLLNVAAARNGLAIEAIDGFARLGVRPSPTNRRSKRRIQRGIIAPLNR